MTPINLLTRGHTIRGMTNRPNAYKLTTYALPRFATNRARRCASRWNRRNRPCWCRCKSSSQSWRSQPILEPIKVESPEPEKVIPSARRACRPRALEP